MAPGRRRGGPREASEVLETASNGEPTQDNQVVKFSDYTFTLGKDGRWQCGIGECTRSFRRDKKGFLRTHQRDAHADVLDVFLCQEQGCKAKLVGAEDIRKHAKWHTELVVFCWEGTCNGKGFKTAASLREHFLRLHPGEKRYLCQEEGCEKPFLTIEDLANHYKTFTKHKNRKPDTCPAEGCLETFDTHHEIHQHIESEHPFLHFFLCREEKCGRGFLNQYELDEHVSEKHTNSPDLNSLVRRKTPPSNLTQEAALPDEEGREEDGYALIHCIIIGCTKLSTSETGLQRHIERMHPTLKQLLCRATNCKKWFYGMDEREHHESNEHLKCPICEDVVLFDSTKDFLSHLTQEHPDKPEDVVYKVPFGFYWEVSPPFRYFDTLDHSAIANGGNVDDADINDEEEEDEAPMEADDNDEIEIWTESLLAYIKLRNQAFTEHFQKVYSGLTSDFPTPLGSQLSCVGAEGEECPHRGFTRDQVCFLLVIRGTLHYDIRCLLCLHERQRPADRKHKNLLRAKFTEHGKCTSTMGCQELATGFSSMCQFHFDEVKRQKYRQRIKNITRAHVAKNKTGAASLVSSPEELADFIAKNNLMLMSSDMNAMQKLQRNSAKGRVYFVDTEFFGDQLLEVCIIDYDGEVLIDTKIDHGCTREEMWDRVIKGNKSVWGFANKSVTSKMQKLVGNPTQEPMSGMNSHELAVALRALNFSNCTLVEWSTSWCDFRIIHKFLSTSGNEDAMPPFGNTLLPIHAWRRALPGFMTFQLSILFRFVFPDQTTIAENCHRAKPDTLMLRMLTLKMLRHMSLVKDKKRKR